MTAIKNLYTVQQVREFDRIAIEKYHLAGYDLMQRAGAAAHLLLHQHWPNLKNVLVVCGKGNNAGDGYVLAKLLQEVGIAVKVLCMQPPQELEGDALLAAQDCLVGNVTVLPFAADLLKSIPRSLSRAQSEQLNSTELIVDALLGTGLRGAVDPIYREAINAINATGIPIFALDIPSGLNGDTGNVSEVAIKADVTITFVAAKCGLFIGSARDYCGKIYLADLDLPLGIFQNSPGHVELLAFEDLIAFLPKRPRVAHKGDFGYVLVIGGDHGMAGAACMAVEAAARVGAGLTAIATRPEHVAAMVSRRPEIMVHGIKTPNTLAELIHKAKVIVIGPGLGRSTWSKKIWQFILAKKLNQQLVIDADALWHLALKPTKNTNWILTPHVGEAARLLNCNSSIIQADRLSAVQQITEIYGGTCVLKGAGTIISGKQSKIGICPYGNPGMASGGMGDVLSGIIGGLLAQGLSPTNAAQLGTVIHSKAADLAAAENGERGLLALDLLFYVRRLVNGLVQG